HLPQRFTIETQKGSKINIATWNVLQQCQSKAKSGTGYSNNPWDFDEGIKAFEKRREKQLETFDELSGCGIICLQEFSEKDPERQGRIYNILARLAARGGNWNVIDPTKTTDLGDAKNGNIIFYREDKFDVKDRTPSILSPNKNNGSEGIYLGLDVTFRDKKTNEDFIVTNVHGAFGKSDLIQNHCDSLAANSTPAIVVGDFNCHSKELRTKISTDDKIKDSTKVLASDLATNFDTLNAGDRAENAVMNTENKCYDYAVVVDKQYNFKSCEIEAQSFSDKLKNAKNFSSIPLHETEARKCFLGVVQEIFKNPRPDKQTRARLRNIFANSALPDFLREEIVSGKLQMDGAEFLTSALDGITPEKIITDTNEVSWERGEKTSTKSEDHTKLELPFPDKVRDTSCSKMLKFYQEDSQLEGDNKYQSKSGLVDATSKRKITVKADPAHELIVSVKRVYTTGRDASYRRHRASSKVIADSIEIETTSGGKQKYEATAFLVHRGNTPDAGHYVTYIKELVTNKNGSEKVVWALYNDSDRTEIDDSELLNGLPPESVNAYNIKYSPLVDGANDSVTGKARYKTGLPKSQENGTANGGNRCWANAAFAFALSLNSFYDSELDKTSSEVPLTSSQETTPTDTDLNSLIIDDLKGKDSEVLKFFQDLRSKDESEQKKINEDLEQFGYSEKILIGNAVTRFLSTLDTDYKSSDQIWNCLETLSNPKNLEKTIGLISSMDHFSFTSNPEKYLKDNKFETETNSSSISLTEFFIKKLDSEPDSNTFFELLPDAIKIGGADFLADILCHVTSNQNDEVKNRLISEFKADRNKKSQFHKNRSAAEIEAEIGAGLNKRNQPSYSGIRNDTSFTKKSIEATSDANYAIDDSKIEKVDQTNGLNEIRSQLDKISKKPETDKNSKEFYEKSLKPNSLKTVDKNLRIFDEAQIEELEKLKYTDDKKNKTSQKLWYSEFAGIEFRPPNSIDLSSMFATSDEDRGKADLFAGADLFMASFRNCVFENVDLSEVKNLETVGFYNCTFRNCKFSEKFLESIKMHNSENLKIENSEFSIKKLSPIPSNSPRPSLAKVLKAESLHKILSKS
ncbi:MAG: hypothetical protein SFV53_06205, partial [Rickettsiales bacterium]|nr:hypothetical protein [Rickettsiales bacterium]